MAFITKTPELNLSDEEIKVCTDSYANLARFYPAIGMPEKTAAWLDFLSTFGAIYGSKIIGANARKKAEKANIGSTPMPVQANKGTQPVNPKQNPYDLPPEMRGTGTVKPPPPKPPEKDFVPPADFDAGEETIN